MNDMEVHKCEEGEFCEIFLMLSKANVLEKVLTMRSTFTNTGPTVLHAYLEVLDLLVTHIFRRIS